jgi:hypothetical protein
MVFRTSAMPRRPGIQRREIRRVLEAIHIDLRLMVAMRYRHEQDQSFNIVVIHNN